MQTQTLKESANPLFPLQMLKDILLINTDHTDMQLAYYLRVATAWVEDNLNKSLLRKTLLVKHNNTRFCLPYGPVCRIIEVKYHKTVLRPDQYTQAIKGDSLIIEVPFHWGKDRTVEVTYEAGYGDHPDDVPQALRHAVLGTVSYLYDNQGDKALLEQYTAPWLQAHRLYRMG